MGAAEGANRQEHSEQPKPRKCLCSIHTSLRLMAAYVAAPQRCLTTCPEPARRQRTNILLSQRRTTCLQQKTTQLGRGGRCLEGRAEFTCANLDGLSGTLHTWKIPCRAEHCIISRVFEDRLWTAKATRSSGRGRIPPE